jgi:ribose-phosphate pyrophosphokinase
MISTGGTMAETIDALLEAGARSEIIVAATHGLLLPGARDKLSHAAVREIVVTDTVEAEARPPIAVVSVAPLLAGAIQRFLVDGSLSDLY